MNDSKTLWQSIFSEQSISISLLHKKFTLSIYPILLLVVHTAVFLATRPYIDLPVYDDAFYFAKATLLTRGIFTLHGDWSPLLVYFASIFRFVISGNPILAFALYTYFCQLVFLFGSYSLILVFTRKKDWAFLSTLLIAVVISYPLNINGHLFPAGAVMSIAACLEKKKNVDIYLAAALVLISVSLRFEYILILGGLIVRSFYRYYAAGKWTSIFKPNVLSIVALTAAIAIWIPIFLWGFRNQWAIRPCIPAEIRIVRSRGRIVRTKRTVSERSMGRNNGSVFPRRKTSALYVQSIFPNLFNRFGKSSGVLRIYHAQRSALPAMRLRL